MASRRKAARISSSVKKVCATGAGFASPVVSIRIPSSLSLRLSSRPRIRIRSPRTEQQMHPLFISKSSSSLEMTSWLSTPTSPNSFSMTASLQAVLLGEDAVEQRRFSGAEEAGQNRNGNGSVAHNSPL